MTDIIALLACFDQSVDKTTVRQLNRIIVAMLTMTGRVTMLGISRWTEKGGSYRTIQRFFGKTLPWLQMSWLFVRHHLLNPEDEYLLAGDETVVTKAGKQTHGLDRFFSSLYGKPVPGLAFFALSLVSVQERKSYPLLVEQRVRSEEEKEAARKKAKQKKTKSKKKSKGKGKRGRPKGSKNKDKTQVEWTPELRFVQRSTPESDEIDSGLLFRLISGPGWSLRQQQCLADGPAIDVATSGQQIAQQCGTLLCLRWPAEEIRSSAVAMAPRSTIKRFRASIVRPSIRKGRSRPTSTRPPCCTSALLRP